MKKKKIIRTTGFTEQVDGDNLSVLYNPITEQMMVIDQKTLVGSIINPGQQFEYKGSDALRREFNLLAYQMHKKLGQVK